MHIHANQIDAEPDDDERLAFLFFQEKAGHYLVLSRSNLEDYDRGIELELNEQTRRAERAVAECILVADRLLLRIRPEHQSKIGAAEITVTWPVPCPEFFTIRESLRRIFRDGAVFQD